MTFSPGEVIFDAGEKGGEMFLVLQGDISITLQGAEIDRLATGDLFGEMSLVEERPRSARAVARTGSRLMRIDRTAFRTLVKESPDFALHVMSAMSARLRRFIDEEVGRQRLEEELRIGRQIQLSLMPDACPMLHGWEFAAAYEGDRVLTGMAGAVARVPSCGTSSREGDQITGPPPRIYHFVSLLGSRADIGHRTQERDRKRRGDDIKMHIELFAVWLIGPSRDRGKADRAFLRSAKFDVAFAPVMLHRSAPSSAFRRERKILVATRLTRVALYVRRNPMLVSLAFCSTAACTLLVIAAMHAGVQASLAEEREQMLAEHREFGQNMKVHGEQLRQIVSAWQLARGHSRTRRSAAQPAPVRRNVGHGSLTTAT